MKKLAVGLLFILTLLCCTFALADLSVVTSITGESSRTATASWSSIEEVNSFRTSSKSNSYSDSILLYQDSQIETNQQVTVTYTFDTDTATIGQPFTVNYEITGGSGQYNDFSYTYDEVTEHCCIGGQGGKLTSPRGSFTIIPERGDYIDFWVNCTDTVTGIMWNENASGYIKCNPSTDIPVNITNLPDSLEVNKPFTFAYSIGGNDAITEARVEIWEFYRNDTYPDCMYEQSIDNRTDNVTYTPRAGNQLYIAIYGKTSSGQPFYSRTPRLEVDTTSAYEPVTVEYSYPDGSPQIGHPFTLSYEIKGGSGQYEEISYAYDEIAEHCCIGGQGGNLSAQSGTITIIPEHGDNIDVWVSCKDSVTGIYWNENPSGYIPCSPNAEIPIDISIVSPAIEINAPFSFSYSINDIENINDTRAEIWVFVRNDTYPDLVHEQNINEKNGTVTYTPKSGNQLYIAIYGKDTAGQPFYARTERINIGSGTEYIWSNDYTLLTARRGMKEETVSVQKLIVSPTNTLAGEIIYTSDKFNDDLFVPQTRRVSIPALNDMKTLYLPSGIQTIEAEAFSGLPVEAIIVPEGCTFIDRYAFKDCNSLRYVLLPTGIVNVEDLFSESPDVIVDLYQN